MTGGKDPSYALPLLSSLISKGIIVEFIGNDEMQKTNIVRNKNVHFYNLYGSPKMGESITEKAFRVLNTYFKVAKYVANTDSKLFHVLWEYKSEFFDWTFLNLYCKILRKKLVFTSHNINARLRDGNNTLINRLKLLFMYKIVDHIFVHSSKMKLQLVEDFNIREKKVTVISFGINNIIPNSELTSTQARKKFGLKDSEKVLLFFGRIVPYKGLEYLILALSKLKDKNNDFKLIIAGQIKYHKQVYWENIKRMIKQNDLGDYIIEKIEFIPDSDVEVYFKAADVLVLPYVDIFQSGVTFLAYNFGLPVIATDAGSLGEEIVEGKTGFVCKPEDSEDLANKIDRYFQSDLYKNLEANRDRIIKYANEKYSWEKIGEKTYDVYNGLL